MQPFGCVPVRLVPTSRWALSRCRTNVGSYKSNPEFQGACDPANDLPSVPGNRGNSDCVPTGSFNPCAQIRDVPVSSDCSSGGTCDQIGKGPGTPQCDNNGFCVLGDLTMPLAAAPGYYDANGFAGYVLFGWDDAGTEDDTRCRWNVEPPARRFHQLQRTKRHPSELRRSEYCAGMHHGRRQQWPGRRRCRRSVKSNTRLGADCVPDTLDRWRFQDPRTLLPRVKQR